MKAGHVVRQIN